MRPLPTILLAFLVLARPAAAYIDPSAGSIVIQLLLGGAAGVLVIVKLYWRRLVALVRRRPVESDDASVARSGTSE